MKTGSCHPALIAIVGMVLSLALPGVARGQATDVNVTNPASNPVNVQPVSDSQPFVITTDGSFNFLGEASLALFPNLAPSGYRAIITHVSVIVRISKNQLAFATVQRVALPLAFQGTIGFGSSAQDVYMGNPAVDIFVDPGGGVHVVLEHEPPTQGTFIVTLQGHYAKAPTTPR